MDKINIPIKFISKAPAKIIISGEHAVVYGTKAISCAINLYATCEVQIDKIEKENTSVGFIKLNLINLDEVRILKYDQICKINDFIRTFKEFPKKDLFSNIINESIEKFMSPFNTLEFDQHNQYFALMLNFVFSYLIYSGLNNYNLIETKLSKFFLDHNITITISLNFSHGAGLGSSAALNLSLATNLVKLFNFITRVYNNEGNDYSNSEQYLNNDLIFLFSYIGEKFFHSKPSGIDNITSIHKGIILFKRYDDFTHIKPSKTFSENFKFFLIDTKIRRDTKKFIQKVKDFKTTQEKIFMNSIDSINIISQEIHKNITCENLNCDEIYSNLTQLIQINQNLLGIIQVSHPEIDRIVNILSTIGVPSKLTGGGGGGYMIALVNKNNYNNFLETTADYKINTLECEILYNN